MALNDMLITTICLLWLLIGTLTASQTQSPNIIFLLLDDLGFSDIGYNGATYPTPVFDELVSTDAIKFNLHYSESTCSPSRSSLYTGRYSFKSGLNKNVDQEAHYHFDRKLTLYPQLLQNNGYNTFLAGKWDIGYKYTAITPPNRGFDEGLYPHNWRPYSVGANGWSLDKYDDYYPTSNDQVLDTRDAYFSNGRMPHWDLWKIRNGIEVPALIGDDTYTETLYTDAILDFLDGQSRNGSFYVHYNLVTPHSPIIEPPAIDTNFAYNYSICDISDISTDKQLFCKSMLYAQERIDRIIRKTKSKQVWSNTVFIVVSDNGGDQEQNVGIAEGQNLPLRGLKTGVNEGGIRTPAFMFGGYIETLLSDLGLSGKKQCVYDKLVHISDWYNIITDLANITHGESDEDHDSIDVWGDIVCECDPSCDSSSDPAEERTEIISMRICGDESRYDIDGYPNKTFYATYIIQWPWKLVINSSTSMPDDCPNDFVDGWVDRNSYTGYSGKKYTIPNQEFFDKWYQPQIDAGRGNLYRSQCLKALDGTDDINDEDYAPFKYEEFMLYNLDTDKIEACNVAADHQDEVTALWNEIQLRSLEYTPIQNVPHSVGAMFAKVNTYDCDTGYTFLVPWEGDNEDKCGSERNTYDNVDNRKCARIWRRLNDNVAACNGFSSSNWWLMDDLYWKFGIGGGITIMILLMIVLMHRLVINRRNYYELITVEKTIDDEPSDVDL